VDSPTFFSEEELGLLKDSPIFPKVQAQKELFLKSWTTVQGLGLAGNLPDLAYKDWAWAMATATARVVRLKDEGQKVFLAVVPFFDFFQTPLLQGSGLGLQPG